MKEMKKDDDWDDRPTQEQIARIEKAVLETHERSINAMRKHDPSAVMEAFSPDFSSAGGDWQFTSRDEIVSGLESGKLQYKSITSEVTNIRIPSTRVAVVTHPRSVEAIIDGMEFSSNFTTTAVYVRERGDWRVILWAVTC